MRLYCKDVLRKKARKKSCTGAYKLLKERNVKHTIAILLVLVLASVGLFATPTENNDKNAATVNITSNVSEYSAFGVSLKKVESGSFNSIATFQDAVQSSVANTVDMLNLHDFVAVGFLSGINNTKSEVKLTVTIDELVSGKDTVAMLVSPASATITPAKDSKFGTLVNSLIQVKEATSGAAALAPAGEYTTTVTIALVTA